MTDRWPRLFAPGPAASRPFSLDDLVTAVSQEIACPIVLDVLPPGLGPEISGLCVVVDDLVRVYHPPGPEWIRLVVVARQLAHVMLHRPRDLSPGRVPIRAADDPDGELLGGLLVERVERAAPHAAVGTGDDGAAAVAEELDLVLALRASLADVPADVPADAPVDVPADGPTDGAADRLERLRRRCRRAVTDVYDLSRPLGPLVPADLPGPALDHARRAGLPSPVAEAVAERICLEAALAARRAGRAPSAHADGWRLPVALPGRTPSEAAARLAAHERVVRAPGVRAVVEAGRTLRP